MLHLCYSNRTEALLGELVRRLDAERAAAPSPLAPMRIIVPNRNMERFLELGIARALGVAANLEMLRLESFVRDWVAASVPDRAWLETRVLDALLDEAAVAEPAMEPVASYLRGAGGDPEALDLRRVQLALRVGALFEQYMFSRPSLLDAWLEGRAALDDPALAGTEAWQRFLFRRCLEDDGSLAPLHRALQGGSERGAPPSPPLSPPPPLHVFGVSYAGPVFQWAFAALARELDLHVYALNPCREFWEDMPSASERRRRRLTSAQIDTLEHHPQVEASDTPPLVMWGRPGREYVHLLNDLTECDFTSRFVDPAGGASTTLLEQLQHDILVRAPERSEPDPAHDFAGDRSIEVLACPGLRREVESVAEAIWALVGADDADSAQTTPPLRFHEIAVLVNGPDRDRYLPHIEAVFDEAHRIPHHVVDVPLAQASRVIDAALALIALPASRLGRPDLLDIVTHPCVRARAPEADPAAWVALCDRLGVFHGLDHAEHRGTYIDQDLVNWDQAVRRVALGRFMTAERSGDERAFELGPGRVYVPEETDDPTASTFALLVRSLLEDVRFARGARMPLAEWARWLSNMVASYLTPTDEAERSDLRRCLSALQALGDRPLGDRPLRHRVAAELARGALGSLVGDRGEYLADGVAVSTLIPMRAIPFRAVFVLGLGEGRFPTNERRDALDLRGARRRLGDVSPTDRDRYAFLEAMLSARERLVLSYVARDERTGDPIAPSPVLEQLLDVIEGGYLQGARQALVDRPALRRYDANGGDPSPVLTEAQLEARARRLGEDMRGAMGTGDGSLAGRAELLGRLRADLGPSWPALARLLALPHFEPERTEIVEPRMGSQSVAERLVPETIRLPLRAIRRFLECPMQGWARAVLGVAEAGEEGTEAREDEPFEPSSLDASILMTRVFLAALRQGRPIQEVYVEEVARLAAHGRWPVGVLAGVREVDDAALLEGWRRECETLAGGAFVPALVRFGPDVEHGDADRVLPPIVLEMDDPRPGSTGPVRVELIGRTDPLVEPASASLLLDAGRDKSGKSPEERLTHRRRKALRSFVTHLALAASGAQAGLGGGEHEAWLLERAREGTACHRARFAPASASVARAWLDARARELLGGTHAYFMPCEAVLRLDDLDVLDASGFASSIEAVRGSGGSSRFGPVPDAALRPAPEPSEALAMARDRFGLLFELLDRGALR